MDICFRVQAQGHVREARHIRKPRGNCTLAGVRVRMRVRGQNAVLVFFLLVLIDIGMDSKQKGVIILESQPGELIIFTQLSVSGLLELSSTTHQERTTIVPTNAASVAMLPCS
ncbi:hypothetical protein HRR83_001481 [Exophiala dermatitidis]|uniref:Uncharacterized protein n=1 Tax=Exophiala dermatitidis TaxID=5970 RepID=A0AAN6F1N6_EXODE|nr:hypothetical protein HRR74_001485 [Exophiala dermatitidis]KAJ4526767.1 hypothetical protein HRR73_001562 [Exophiala dermatitidis]KAJ4532472.1 hypothetical protein HRR76_007465 [Exophiala dermatitidis]KAJ4547018.1 hypothetical protein HRR77_004554 [Exophiala dermatitidis]KAJ4573621.1 hypothetical protein HRR79_002636 [Exophiala dermatitidis]